MIDAGTYEANLMEAVLAEKDGKQQVVLEFDIIGQNARRKVYLHLSEAAEEYTFDKLKRLGFNGHFEPDKMQFANGDGATLSCKHEEWKGEMKEKWDVGGGMPSPASMDKIKAFGARYRAVTGTAPAKPAGAPAAPPKAAPPAPSKAPPPPTQPADPTLIAKDKDEAWSEWDRVMKGKATPERFYAAIEEVGEGRGGIGESQFTPEDWNNVASMAPPF